MTGWSQIHPACLQTCDGHFEKEVREGRWDYSREEEEYAEKNGLVLEMKWRVNWGNGDGEREPEHCRKWGRMGLRCQQALFASRGKSNFENQLNPHPGILLFHLTSDGASTGPLRQIHTLYIVWFTVHGGKKIDDKFNFYKFQLTHRQGGFCFRPC